MPMMLEGNVVESLNEKWTKEHRLKRLGSIVVPKIGYVVQVPGCPNFLLSAVMTVCCCPNPHPIPHPPPKVSLPGVAHLVTATVVHEPYACLEYQVARLELRRGGYVRCRAWRRAVYTHMKFLLCLAQPSHPGAGQ